VARSRNHCCHGNATFRSVCIVELRITSATVHSLCIAELRVTSATFRSVCIVEPRVTATATVTAVNILRVAAKLFYGEFV
jgi:hypothetical protein